MRTSLEHNKTTTTKQLLKNFIHYSGEQNDDSETKCQTIREDWNTHLTTQLSKMRIQA